MCVVYVVYRRKFFSILNLNILLGKKVNLVLSYQEKLKIKNIRFLFFCNLKANTHGYLLDIFYQMFMHINIINVMFLTKMNSNYHFTNSKINYYNINIS